MTTPQRGIMTLTLLILLSGAGLLPAALAYLADCHAV